MNNNKKNKEERADKKLVGVPAKEFESSVREMKEDIEKDLGKIKLDPDSAIKENCDD